MAGTGVTIVSDAAALKATLDAYDSTIVFFHGDWCSYCRRIAPTFDALSGTPGLVFLGVAMSGTRDELWNTYGVNSLPTFQVWKGGRMVDQKVGATDNELREFVARNA